MIDTSISNQLLTRRVRNIVLIAVGLGIFALVGTFLLVNMFVNNELLTNPNACPADNRALIERAAGFTFPPSASSIYARCINWQEWRGQIAFDMNPADMLAFLGSAAIEDPLQSTGKPQLHALFADDTLSAQIEHVGASYLYGENRRADVWQYILIDTANASSYRVHILFGRD
ncbi:MAG: hypothetical protein ABI690_11285 [Chloroflexota bacterium]